MNELLEKKFIDEQIQWQRDAELDFQDVRYGVDSNMEKHLLNIHLPIDLGILRNSLSLQKNSYNLWYHRSGKLKGQDYVSMRVEDDNSRVFANLESDIDFLEVNRELRISSLYILHKGYQFSPKLCGWTKGSLVSPEQKISTPYRKKGHYFGFYFPGKELTGEKYTFQIEPVAYLGEIKVYRDESLTTFDEF